MFWDRVSFPGLLRYQVDLIQMQDNEDGKGAGFCCRPVVPIPPQEGGCQPREGSMEWGWEWGWRVAISPGSRIFSLVGKQLFCPPKLDLGVSLRNAISIHRGYVCWVWETQTPPSVPHRPDQPFFPGTSGPKQGCGREGLPAAGAVAAGEATRPTRSRRGTTLTRTISWSAP